MIAACPYCLQKINTLGKEKKFLDEGKNCEIKCPKCKLNFLLTPDGTEQIPSELSLHPMSRSCCTIASHY